MLFAAAALLAVIAGLFADREADEAGSGRTSFVVTLTAALLIGASFMLLREKLMLLGDGKIRIGTIGGPLFGDLNELGDTFVHRALYRLMAGTGVSGGDIYRWSSVAAGWVFLAISFFWTNRLSKGQVQRPLIFLVIVSSGSLALFYGHPESYALFNCAVLVFVLLVDPAEPSIARTLLLSAACLTAAFFHLAGIGLLPALAVAWRRHAGRTWQKIAWAAVFATVFIMLAVCLLPAVSARTQLPAVLPLFPSAERPYAVFSGGHILDLVNQLLLVAAVPLILLMCSRPRDIFGRKAGLLTAVAGCFLFAMLVDIFFEAADWDLLAFISLPLAVLAARAIIDQNLRRPWPVAGLILGTMCFHTAPWVVSNAVPSIALRQYSEIALRYRHHDTNWLFVRGTYILTSNLCQKYREAVDLGNQALENGIVDARIHNNLMIASYHLEDYQRAVDHGRQAVAIDSTYAEAWHYLGESHNYLKNYGSAVTAFNKAAALGDTAAEVFYGLGYAMQSLGCHREAVDALNRSIRQSPNDLRYLKTALHSFYSMNDRVQAAELIDRILLLSPGDQDARRYRSLILLKYH